MRRLAVVVAAVLALIVAASAHATTSDARIDAVASTFAQQRVQVLCYEKGEPDAPEWYGAWGYVRLHEPVEHMAPEVCAGALGLLNQDPAVPDWQKALGAMVLTHESYHLRKSLSDRGNEARTQCRTIRHVRYAMLMLGATEEQSQTLMGFALALHWRLAANVPKYNQADCKVPNWY